MKQTILHFINLCKETFLKELTVLIFFILPGKVTKTFLFLSLVNLLKAHGDDNHESDLIDLKKFKDTLDCSFDESLLVLPSYTISWFWDEEFLDTPVKMDSDVLTLRRVLTNKTLFDKYHDRFLNEFIKNLPPMLKIKLGTASKRHKEELKNDMYQILAT